MGKCVNHPDRETSYLCMKHNTYLCEECLKCRDPNIYCKFRSSCPIWFLSKRKEGLDAGEKVEKADTGNEHKVIFLPDGKEVAVSGGMTLPHTDVDTFPSVKKLMTAEKEAKPMIKGN